MKKRILHLIFISGLIFNITACQKNFPENIQVESESQQQIEKTSQMDEVEEESLSQVEENETETINQIKEISDVVQNEYFSVFFDSVTENDNFYIFNFIFTNVSDISYYKGDELYHPGESWEKNCTIVKDKLQDYCKNSNYIHYKLYNLSAYEPNTQELFSGGARFDLNEELEIYNLETFVDIPIEKN